MFKSFINAVKLMFTGRVKSSFEEMVLQEAIKESKTEVVDEIKPKKTRAKKTTEGDAPVKKPRTKKNK